MDTNVFNNIFKIQDNKNHLLDSTSMINDSIFENTYNLPFCIENQINPNNFQMKENYLNDINNLELNNKKILSDTAKPFAEESICSKKVKVPDNYFVDNVESFGILDSHESKVFSQQKKKRGRKSKRIYNSYNELKKFSNDNNIRKCKTLVLTYFRIFKLPNKKNI